MTRLVVVVCLVVGTAAFCGWRLYRKIVADPSTRAALLVSHEHGLPPVKVSKEPVIRPTVLHGEELMPVEHFVGYAADPLGVRLETDSAIYIVGEMCPRGMVESIRRPGERGSYFVVRVMSPGGTGSYVCVLPVPASSGAIAPVGGVRSPDGGNAEPVRRRDSSSSSPIASAWR